jgi:hypothetical protein
MLLRNKRNIINDNEDIFNDEENENYDIVFSKSYMLKDFYNNIYHVGVFIFEYTYKGFKLFINVSGIYLVWIFLHYISSQLYVKLCVPNTIIGFLISPFMTATPHCQGLRWIIYNAANVINNMWIIFGAWICSTILIINRDPTPTPISPPTDMSS